MTIHKTTLVLLVLVAGLCAAFLTSLLTSGMPRAHADPPVKWSIRCVDSEKAGVKQDWLNHDLYKPDGWNAALKRYGDKGWEPVAFLVRTGGTHAGMPLQAVCFKRPRTGAGPSEEE